MKKKRVLLAGIAAALVMGISVLGTLAYLKAETGPVTNTFTAQAGLIDSANDFTLDESAVTFSNGNYVQDTAANPARVNTSTYKNVVPGMTIYKDPTVHLKLSNGAYAYLYIEVVDTLTDNSGTPLKGSTLLPYSVDTTKWTKLDGVTGSNGGAVYYLTSGPLSGNGTTSTDYSIFTETGKTLTVSPNAVFKTTDSAETEGTETETNSIGKLTFYAYVAQAQGATDAKTAFTNAYPAS